MIAEKEAQLDLYHQLTTNILQALATGKEDEVLPLLSEREVCITVIDGIDQAAGQLLLNEKIQQQLTELVAMEQKVQSMLHQSLRKMDNLVRSVQNEKFLVNQYTEQLSISKGVFYDRRK